MSRAGQYTQIDTLADLRRFLEQCQRLGIPDTAAPYVATGPCGMSRLLTIHAEGDTTHLDHPPATVIAPATPATASGWHRAVHAIRSAIGPAAADEGTA